MTTTRIRVTRLFFFKGREWNGQKNRTRKRASTHKAQSKLAEPKPQIAAHTEEPKEPKEPKEQVKKFKSSKRKYTPEEKEQLQAEVFKLVMGDRAADLKARRWQRWAAVLILSVSVMLMGSNFTKDSFWGYTAGPYIFFSSIVFFALSLRPVTKEWFSAEDNEKADADLVQYKSRYSRLTRASRLAYPSILAIGVVFLFTNIALVMNGQFRISAVSISGVLLLPSLISYYFSERLMTAMVPEIDYIKGTATCREVTVYWIVLIIVTIHFLLEPEDQFFNNIIVALGQALSFVALGKIASTGYKDYKEALTAQGAREVSQSTDTESSNENAALEVLASSSWPKASTYDAPAPRLLKKGDHLTRSQLRSLRAISAPGMTPGRRWYRFPYNQEPYGRARVPTALGILEVDGKVLRTEDGPLVEFWRRMPQGRILHLYLPFSWVEPINPEGSEWTDIYDVHPARETVEKPVDSLINADKLSSPGG